MTKKLELAPLAKPLIVFGSRDLDDAKMVLGRLKALTDSFVRCHVLLKTDTGTARTKGPERIAEEWATKNWFPMRLYFPWGRRTWADVAKEMFEEATDGGSRKAYAVGFVRRGDQDEFPQAMVNMAKVFDAKLKVVRYSYA